MKELIEKLNGKTIATMESCTGGGLANEITNVEGASKIFSFSAITYSDEFKMKMGVAKEVIDKYTVYSIETAKAMAEAISFFADSNYGIGITGQISTDSNMESLIYFSIYDKDKFYNQTISMDYMPRKKAKEIIIKVVIDKLKEIL